MSGNKEEKPQAAADRIKAAALCAAKGLSRAQAERAATAATRNVNAYGQKEEGPSRWQEKREARRQMYLMSTEKAVRLGERKDKATMPTMGASQCQKCLQAGHWTFECKNERVYMSRSSRTQQLKNPKLRMKLSISYDLDIPDGQDKKDDDRSKKSKRKYRSDSGTGSDSEASVFETDIDASSVTGSEYSSEGSSTDCSSSSESEEERRRRRRKKKKKQKKGRRRRYSSSSESSDSDSDSDDRSRQKKSSRCSRKR
ncbi:outer envelope pore protein 16-2 [Hibiscus syriacus]|uniref:Outer envelope pore protein 16-2 n=1 Tax=Hibiscus syriacus TaxID=106335 RepID=A0A6A3CEJ0_HIBSY|nr:zinc finger CCHC domain-containing protein 10-like [Hibiscus syriacus]XP_039058295.1 zinc finger CCHC domain-containing protein 10-like [Hibiscus syriacus]KAE8725848.1 outer envelope pore protein 16-2 [Hibiscus syriacus]